jgi:hypothetical protein
MTVQGLERTFRFLTQNHALGVSDLALHTREPVFGSLFFLKVFVGIRFLSAVIDRQLLPECALC